ncbi:MAG: hypothetical protein ABWY29_05975 [Blastococcus sp.]
MTCGIAWDIVGRSFRGLRGVLCGGGSWDHQGEDDGECEAQQHRAAGECGPDLVGQQIPTGEPDGPGGGEDGDEDAQSQRAADLVEDVDQTGGRAGVLRCDPGNPGGRDRGQHAALAGSDQQHRQRDPHQVGAVGGDPAEPRHPHRGDEDPVGE